VISTRILIADWLTSQFLSILSRAASGETVPMEDAEKEQEDERLDIQASYLSTINEFKSGLKQWLQKDPLEEGNEDFEDRDLDALLLKVPPRFWHSLMQIEPFQEQPNLLDSALQSLIDPLIPSLLEAIESGFTVQRQKCFRIMYHYTKIRGYKVTSTLPINSHLI
jgi:hypothetical protein